MKVHLLRSRSIAVLNSCHSKIGNGVAKFFLPILLCAGYIDSEVGVKLLFFKVNLEYLLCVI